MLADLKLSDYLQAVAAKKPTPGGGSVSAAAAAVAAALGVMVARFSDNLEADTALEAVKDELLKIVDTDAEAYGQVSSAMALPKATDEEKNRRKEALQNALGEAAEVPLKGMEQVVRGLAVLGELAPKCGRHMTSDFATAGHLLWAALLGFKEFVLVNARSLTDKGRSGKLQGEADRLEAEGKRAQKMLLRGGRKADGGK